MKKLVFLMGLILCVTLAGCDMFEGVRLGPVDGVNVVVELSIDDTVREFHTGCEGELAGHNQQMQISSEGVMPKNNPTAWQRDLSIYSGHYQGWYHCYSPYGEQYDFTHSWDSLLSFEAVHNAPEVHLRVYGDEVYVLLGPGNATYDYPGCPDRTYCQEPDGLPVGPATTNLRFSHLQNAQRPPDADTSSLSVVNSGIIVDRILLDDLLSGTSLTKTLSLDGGCQGEMTIVMTLTSGD